MKRMVMPVMANFDRITRVWINIIPTVEDLVDTLAKHVAMDYEFTRHVTAIGYDEENGLMGLTNNETAYFTHCSAFNCGWPSDPTTITFSRPCTIMCIKTPHYPSFPDAFEHAMFGETIVSGVTKITYETCETETTHGIRYIHASQIEYQNKNGNIHIENMNLLSPPDISFTNNIQVYDTTKYIIDSD